MKVLYAYDVMSPIGEKFQSAIIENEKGFLDLYSTNANGDWEPETRFGLGDLAQRFQQLDEWEIIVLDQSDANFPKTIL